MSRRAYEAGQLLERKLSQNGEEWGERGKGGGNEEGGRRREGGGRRGGRRTYYDTISRHGLSRVLETRHDLDADCVPMNPYRARLYLQHVSTIHDDTQENIGSLYI